MIVAILTIIVSIGILLTSQNVSALTYTQRYSEGMSQGYIDCNDGNDYHPNSPYLTSHSIAYQNGYNQGSYNCHHGIPEQTKSTIEAQPTETLSTTARCDASKQTCGYNQDGSSYPIHNNNNHVSEVESTTSVNPFPRHCDIGGWPSCYNTGYNAGLDDGKKGLGNGNCISEHSANFCSGYYNGWQNEFTVRYIRE